MKAKAFDNVKSQIGYCAIWCGSCVVGNGALKELTKEFNHIIESYGVDKWGAEDQGFDGQELMQTLKSIQDIPVCPGCRKGGGATNCRIRACASNKKLVDCTNCEEFMTCENREALQKVRSGALDAGMSVKTDKDATDQQELIEKWTAELTTRFPHRLILSNRGIH
jgi:thiol-disulfide isomerase/thioredoxin